MIFIKFCKQCKMAFDIGINYDICPECRRKNKEEGEEDENKKN